MFACVVSYVPFVVSLFVPHLPFFWCLGRANFVILSFPGYIHLYVLLIDKGFSHNFVYNAFNRAQLFIII